MTKTPPTIQGMLEEFDQFEDDATTHRLAKKFIRQHIEAILEYLEEEELNAERELGWSRKDFEEALDTSDDYRELGEFDGHNQAVKKFNAKIKKVRGEK